MPSERGGPAAGNGQHYESFIVRVLLRWPPDFERLVLEYGDDKAVHVGAKGGVRMTGLEVDPSPAPGLSSEARQWLSNNGIDWDGTPA